MDGTAFFKAYSQEAFALIKQTIDDRMVQHVGGKIVSVAKPEWMRVMVSSGSWLQIEQIKLYNREKVDEIARVQRKR